MSVSVVSVVSRFLEEYVGSTPQRLKLLDAYLLYILLTGAMQFLYCLLVGTFPFNSFLSGFTSCVGSFILGVCLRIQINPQNKGDFLGISPERAFADFLFANTILHLVVINFLLELLPHRSGRILHIAGHRDYYFSVTSYYVASPRT
ncbi:unnamed protein product [Ranitomeya imitator]|uniref:Dolichyl-diphosphooligosaccharide--protein glycosyltransferase subunit DAD1 n=1 Tax=Ranitomeya imitator TaxID=111125 RepID=A0ABN9KYY6_9NEOB|nr:unnamed protein product [Ranitomeya imitator]